MDRIRELLHHELQGFTFALSITHGSLGLGPADCGFLRQRALGVMLEIQREVLGGRLRLLEHVELQSCAGDERGLGLSTRGE